MNKRDKEFILNIQSEILQGNLAIALNKIKSYRLLNDF